MSQFSDGTSGSSSLNDVFTDGSEYTTNLSAQVQITEFGLEIGTTRNVFIKWTWNQLHTKEFRVVWYYFTGQGTSFVGSDARVTNKYSSYNAPSNATKVNDDKNYVQLDGSDLLTPCSSSVNVKDGERVMVVVGGHEAVVTGNMSSPAARLGDVDDAKKEIGDTVDQSLDAYDVKLAQMNELAANTLRLKEKTGCLLQLLSLRKTVS